MASWLGLDEESGALVLITLPLDAEEEALLFELLTGVAADEEEALLLELLTGVLVVEEEEFAVIMDPELMVAGGEFGTSTVVAVLLHGVDEEQLFGGEEEDEVILLLVNGDGELIIILPFDDGSKGGALVPTFLALELLLTILPDADADDDGGGKGMGLIWPNIVEFITPFRPWTATLLASNILG